MLTYDDFEPGRIFKLPPHTVTQEEILAFAQEFDPQPFHLDAESGQAQFVGGLIASGWHTCSMLMRMICDGFLNQTASQGSSGLEEIRWLRPVRPGDRLAAGAEVIDRRHSRSNPQLAIVTFHYEMKNQHDETVMTMKGMGMFKDAGEKRQ